MITTGANPSKEIKKIQKSQIQKGGPKEAVRQLLNQPGMRENNRQSNQSYHLSMRQSVSKYYQEQQRKYYGES